MKAKVIKTGKVVDVMLNKNEQPTSETGAMYIYNSSDGTRYLNTELDFVNVYPDRQQIRVQASVAAMQGIMVAISPERFTCRPNAKAVAKASVEYADALIEELFKD